MIVVDASALVELLAHTALGDAVAERLLRAGQAYAPHHVDVEVVHSLRGMCLRGIASTDVAAEMLDDFRGLRIIRYPATDFIERIWSLRHGISAYDAAYVALAEHLGAPLLTADGRLARARGHAAEVELVTAR